MDGSERARCLARRRRRRRNQIFTALVSVLLLAAVILFAATVLRSCSEKTPAQTEPDAQTPVSTTQPAPAASAPPVTSVPAEPAVPETTAPTEPTEPTVPSAEPPQDDDWKLILVNAEHPLPEGYSVTLKELRNGHHVDERIYPELQQMFDDARAAGIYPYINESYRTSERQQQILDKYVAQFEAEGLSHDDARRAALERVALPGTSEHELGLALDIIAEYDGDSSATWQWLKNNCWRYGFILRYPEDKAEITGITYEPWHFRYVGTPAAQEITEQGLCLEEYLSRNE